MYDYSGLYSSANSFGSHMFSNFTIEGNGDSSVNLKELQNSVLGCLNEIICTMQPR